MLLQKEASSGGAADPVFAANWDGVTRGKMATDQVELSISHVMPPAREIAKRVLHLCEQNKGGFAAAGLKVEQKNVQQTLLDDWSSMHELLTPSSVGPLPPLAAGSKGSLATKTLCQQVGYCMCGPAFRGRRRFRVILASLVRSFFKKGTVGRDAHDRAIAVLRLASDCGRIQVYYFIGFANLNDNDFTVKLLKPLPAVPFMPGHAFEADGPPSDLEIIGSRLDLDRAYSAELLRLDVNSQMVLPFEFRPLAFVESLEPQIVTPFWPPPICPTPHVGRAGGRGGRAAGRGRGRGAALQQDVPLDGIQDVPPPMFSDTYGEVFEDDAHGVLQDVDRLLQEAQGWQLSSSDDEAAALHVPENKASLRRVGVSAYILSAVKHGERPPAVVAPPLSCRVASAAGASSSVATTRSTFKPCRDFRSIWPKILHSQNELGQRCFLRLSTTWGNTHQDMRAVCIHHGSHCSKSRSCKFERPVGRLWAWLNAGAAIGSKEDHAKYVPTLEDRTLARLEFENLPDTREFLDAECGGFGLGEPDRTW